MSVYSLVSSLRRLFVVSLPEISMPATWLRAGAAVSLVSYFAMKIYSVVFGLPSAYFELLLLPACVCAIALLRTTPSAQQLPQSPTLDAIEEAAIEDGWSDVRNRRPGIAAGALVLILSMTLVALNTVPLITSPDESAIINGGYQIAHNGSLRIDNALNETYDTNIIGGLHAVNKTATDRYYGAFPGSALLYAPFSYLPSDVAYRLYTALFASIAISALYVVAWRLLSSWPAAFIGALVFAASPAYGHWSVTVFNNIPVLAMELVALGFLVIPAKLHTRHLAAAGALMGLAFFVRITELAFVLPMLTLVVWRTRSWRDCIPFLAGPLAGGALIMLTNVFFFGSALYLPHVGTPYIPLHAATQTSHESQGLVERYFLFAIGTSGSASNFAPTEKLADLWFHVRYLSSSTFAFPFIGIAFAGLALMIAAGRRQGMMLLIGGLICAALVIGIYGQQHNNYFGFGLPIVRSSFVRYSLVVYALLAIAAGGFFLEMGRLVDARRRTSIVMFAGLVALIAWIGIGQSYDREVYGYNRLNAARERDRDIWRDVDAILQEDTQPVLLVVDTNAMKMVLNNEYPDTINYSQIPQTSWDTSLWPVISAASQRQHVYLLISTIQPASQAAREQFTQRYYLERQVERSPWGLYLVEPPINDHACASPCR